MNCQWRDVKHVTNEENSHHMLIGAVIGAIFAIIGESRSRMIVYSVLHEMDQDGDIIVSFRF